MNLHEPVGAAEFKARCLQIMDQVKETGAEVTITKHGHPVAKLVPVAAQVTRPSLLGSCKGSLIILDDDDLVPSTEDEWTDWEARIEQGPDGVLSA
ncbi:MAG: type II toxin-antitoxin system Phd/YefM family antitoxin [Acidimicrobiia bacterium]|nr:type II toxin-antitoxin system Phd/YefM family antitoxin [Acidimicrobiia bacterium]